MEELVKKRLQWLYCGDRKENHKKVNRLSLAERNQLEKEETQGF